MTIKTLDDLFMATLKDMYYAEKKLLKVLPTMAKKAEAAELKRAIERHLGETETHVRRLEQVFAACDAKPVSKKCEALEGLVEEAEDVLGEIEGATVSDAAIIASAQTVEHYEIARYGTMVSWARQLGRSESARLLQETLDEEEAADQTLSDLATNAINERAAA